MRLLLSGGVVEVGRTAAPSASAAATAPDSRPTSGGAASAGRWPGVGPAAETLPGAVRVATGPAVASNLAGAIESSSVPTSPTSATSSGPGDSRTSV